MSLATSGTCYPIVDLSERSWASVHRVKECWCLCLAGRRQGLSIASSANYPLALGLVALALSR